MPPIHFALIGCGRIAKNHAAPLTELPGAHLTAVCDLIPERAKQVGDQYHVPYYTNYHEMLRKETIDVVNILTPSGMHPAHAIDVMTRYGKHVVIEKPMVLSLNDLTALKKAADDRHLTIFPVYQNRYNKAVQKVRSDLQSGRFGKTVLGAIRLRWCRPQSYYDRDPWRGTWAMDGGAMTNQGIHYIDLLQYLLGDVVSVYAKTATQLVTAAVEDTAVATLTFSSGALGNIEITTAARPNDVEASVSILAENGMAQLSGIACNKLDVYTLEPAAMTTCTEDFPDAYGFGHWPFFKDVLAELHEGRPHPVSFNEGTRALRLLNALYRSAEDHREIRLDGDVASQRLGKPDPTLSARYQTPLPSEKDLSRS